MSALEVLATTLAACAAFMAWFIVVDVRAWLDGKPETLTASTVIRRWAMRSPARMAALTGAILTPILLVAWLLGHFPLGLW
jgi:hypothetical protein